MLSQWPDMESALNQRHVAAGMRDFLRQQTGLPEIRQRAPASGVPDGLRSRTTREAASRAAQTSLEMTTVPTSTAAEKGACPDSRH